MRTWGLIAVLALTGCVVDETSKKDGDDTADMGPFQSDGGPLADGSPGRDGDVDSPDARMGRDAEVVRDARTPIADAETPGEDAAPPPDDARALCRASCAHMYECFASDCPALGPNALDGLCEGLCDADRETQEDLLVQACPEYIETLTNFIPELEGFCSDEPVPEECDPICEVLPGCDIDIEGPACGAWCRGLDEDVRDCFTQAARDGQCVDVWSCFPDDEPVEPFEPPPEERCGQLCQRHNVCVGRVCAPGTQAPGATRTCFRECLRDPPTSAELRAEDQRLCRDVVADLRAADPELDGRCDADPDEACVQLCAERVGDCIDAEACQAACPGWNDTNINCLRAAQGRCAVVDVCVNSPENQARCEQQCAHWEDCIGQACPPQILPPNLDTNCAIGCLFEPPSDEEVAAYLALECRDVREQLYENNPELAPICEGDREFRPSPDECVAFCDRGLAACIGVGGRDFCLGACGTLERDEYECALVAGEDCEAIDRCLAD